MRVRVTKEGGFMFGSLQKVGAELTLEKEAHFSKNWMEKIDKVKIVIHNAEATLESPDEPEKEDPEIKGKPEKKTSKKTNKSKD